MPPVRNGSVPASYRRLADEFPLRPIRSKTDCRRARAILDRLAVRGDSLDRGESDYLETLELLVERYDQQHNPIYTGDLGPVDLLTHLMSANGMKAADVGRLIGSKGVASEILRGLRPMSKRVIATLATHFGVGPETFLEHPLRNQHSRRRR